MKRQLKALMITAGLSAMLGVIPAMAQDHRAIAKVPFAFKVEQRSFPAGEYSVAQLNQSGILQLSGEDRHSIMLNAPIPNTADPYKPHLTFACYGKECVLSEISLPGSQVARAFSQHAIEKNLTHKLGMVSMIAIRLGSQ